MHRVIDNHFQAYFCVKMYLTISVVNLGCISRNCKLLILQVWETTTFAMAIFWVEVSFCYLSLSVDLSVYYVAFVIALWFSLYILLIHGVYILFFAGNNPSHLSFGEWRTFSLSYFIQSNKLRLISICKFKYDEIEM